VHTWKAGGSNGAYVLHSSTGLGTASDGIGVGLGEDVLGPFGTRHKGGGRTQTEIVADALTNAYAAGRRFGMHEAVMNIGQQLAGLQRAAAAVVALANTGELGGPVVDKLDLLADQLPDGMVDDYKADLLYTPTPEEREATVREALGQSDQDERDAMHVAAQREADER
jgi:hypothetical protein